MPTTHAEGNLRLTFDDGLRVVKLDDCDFFRHNLMPLQLTRAVDFLGLYRNEAVYLIEIKDYRGSRIELKNHEKMHEGDTLHLQVARKVKDSVACVVGAARTMRDTLWMQCAEKVILRHTHLRVVFWLEFDLPYRRHQRDSAAREAAMKAQAAIREKSLKKALAWLTKQVIVANGTIGPETLPGVTVEDIGRAGVR